MSFYERLFTTYTDPRTSPDWYWINHAYVLYSVGSDLSNPYPTSWHCHKWLQLGINTITHLFINNVRITHEQFEAEVKEVISTLN